MAVGRPGLFTLTPDEERIGDNPRHENDQPSTSSGETYGEQAPLHQYKERRDTSAPVEESSTDFEGRRMGGFRNTVRQLFLRGNTVEGAGKNHKYSTAEKARLKQMQSIDYLAPSSRVYRQWLSAQPWQRYWDRWIMMAAIGIAVGITGFLLHLLIHILAVIKIASTRWLLTHTHVILSWIFNLSYSLGLVYCSTWLVVNIAPEAAGAGVAEVSAYLNGCNIPKILNIKTLGVKFLSAATAVASGLPVGPEGPMVHMGAIIASGMSQGHSTTLGCDSGLFRRFQNPKDKRDFVTVGAAVGIAAAFSAPIGGMLYVFEEVASFWQQALSWQIFFANMIAVLTVDTLRSAESALQEGTFGLFDRESSTVFFEVYTQLNNHVMAMVPAALCGLLCGLLAVAFTIMNLKVIRFRGSVINPDRRLRMAEPCILIMLFVTMGMILPLFFPCTPTQCVVLQGETTPICPDGQPEYVHRVVEETLELFTCSRTSHTSQVHGGGGPGDADGPGGKGNITIPSSYNELATLMSVTGEDAIRHLFSRGTHREFGYAALVVMLVWYFLGAAWTAGSAIASGVFVPMLLIGACVGRLIGLIMVDMAARNGAGSEGAPPGVFLPPHPMSFIDPGAFALIGAGAFMGGVTRMTIALAVILMEVSNDVRILLPLMVAIMVAKWVADLGSHPLYHGLLEVKCIPFLPKAPVSSASLDLIEVRYVMHWPVTSLREHMRLGDVREVLRRTKYQGFPVVRDTNRGPVFVGLLVRDHLLKLLLEAVRRGTCQHLEVSFSDLNHQFMESVESERESEQQMALLDGRPLPGDNFRDDPSLWDETLDLTPYINMSAFKVTETFSLERSYILFCNMGLRHLVVVDEHNCVKGIVTRKDLLGYRLDEAVARARTGSLAGGGHVPGSNGTAYAPA
uniref:Chloride channel protein n=1 Tax=Auxenochlorella protothecoides TaxID=3075 RepID=A0A1D2A2N7_AUXPR